MRDASVQCRSDGGEKKRVVERDGVEEAARGQIRSEDLNHLMQFRSFTVGNVFSAKGSYYLQ